MARDSKVWSIAAILLDVMSLRTLSMKSLYLIDEFEGKVSFMVRIYWVDRKIPEALRKRLKVCSVMIFVSCGSYLGMFV